MRVKNNNRQNQDTNGENEEENELDLIAGGSDADLEADLTYLHNITEKTLLQKNLLAKFVPVVETIVKNILSKYEKATRYMPATFLERVSVLSFCKFMTVSQQYCEERIELLFSLLDLEKYDNKSKSNILIWIGDLFKCHPTVLDKKSKTFFSNLSNRSTYVRRHWLRIISHLALNDMIKVKGEISDIWKLLKDDDPKIKDLVKLFLHELHSKDKETIYGLIPEAINRLSECKNFETKDFEETAQILVKYVEKDKQIEQLLDKLCSKLWNSTTLSEIRNTAYTISILNISDKHLAKLMDRYDKYKAHIQKDDYVRQWFSSIPGRFRKNTDLREFIDDMDVKFNITGDDQLPLSKDTKDIAERFTDRLRLSKKGQISGPGLNQNSNRQELQEIDQDMEVEGQDQFQTKQWNSSQNQEETIPSVGVKRRMHQIE